MIKKIRSVVKKINAIEKSTHHLVDKSFHYLNAQHNDLKSPKILPAKILAEINRKKGNITSLSEVEFQVFSQWGDDGIIQYLIDKLDIKNKTFIEFGVENYKESNTRFLLINNNWKGLVIDGSAEHINYIKHDYVYWSNELSAINAFITCENINSLIQNAGIEGDIGLLSVDIDGNDYWVWEAINVVKPIIVITEYNSLFGRHNKWSIPYDPSFVRGSIYDSSISKYGASLGAFKYLAEKKGYSFIGCNSNGNNAYFIRNDYSEPFANLFNDDGFVLCSFRECFQNNERVKGNNKIKILNGLEVINVETSKVEIVNFTDADIAKHHY
ncbi:MAG: hypothetical protein EOO43_12175 [Flavobacterium sp.]|nr:MAG: hypothetical protein EOO43_12175 [Flavobacterium sp.]